MQPHQVYRKSRKSKLQVASSYQLLFSNYHVTSHRTTYVKKHISDSPYLPRGPHLLTYTAYLHEKRPSRSNTRGRFSWVKRLVQGQNLHPSQHHHHHHQNHQRTQRVLSQSSSQSAVPRGAALERPSEVRFTVKGPPAIPGTPGLPLDDNSTRKSLKSMDIGSDVDSQVSAHSDNISTIPLKLIVSHTSTTNSPSIISSENNQGSASGVPSTAETSLLPSPHASVSPSYYTGLMSTRMGGERERDSESIVTLASSSRRVRRRSIDTNCSMAGIPPTSIMERLTVNPTARDQPGDEEQSIGR